MLVEWAARWRSGGSQEGAPSTGQPHLTLQGNGFTQKPQRLTAGGQIFIFFREAVGLWTEEKSPGRGRACQGESGGPTEVRGQPEGVRAAGP